MWVILHKNLEVMAKQRKFPQKPGLNNDEIPYDYWAFKRWCVNSQSMSLSTADAYISSIRTAFSTLFDDRDALFKNLRNAFLFWCHHPQRKVERLEDVYGTLVSYTETIDELGVVGMGEENIEKVKMWVRAFQAYCRYIRWRIDNIRQANGMGIEIIDNQVTFLEVPMRNQFHKYLMKIGRGYDKRSRYTYYSKLKRLYNLFFRRILKRNVFEEFQSRRYRKEVVEVFLDRLSVLIEEEIEYPRFLDLSEDDLKRGRTAFYQYRYFLNDFFHNPAKYPIDGYEIPYSKIIK